MTLPDGSRRHLSVETKSWDPGPAPGPHTAASTSHMRLLQRVVDARGAETRSCEDLLVVSKVGANRGTQKVVLVLALSPVKNLCGRKAR